MSLIGRLIKDSFKDLLIVNNNNAGVDGTMRPILDGEGTESALQISETGVQVNGDLNITGETTGVGTTFEYKGDWSSGDYSKNDVVSYETGSYVAKATHSGIGEITIDSNVQSDVNLDLFVSKNSQWGIRRASETDGGEIFLEVLDLSDRSLATVVGNRILASTTQSAGLGKYAAVSDDGQTLAVGSTNGYFYIYKYSQGTNQWVKDQEVLEYGSSTVVRCDISPDGNKAIFSDMADETYRGKITQYTWNGTSWDKYSAYGWSTYEYLGLFIRAYNDFYLVSHHNWSSSKGRVLAFQWGEYQSAYTGPEESLFWQQVTPYAEFLHPVNPAGSDKFGSSVTAQLDDDGNLYLFSGDKNSNVYLVKWDSVNNTIVSTSSSFGVLGQIVAVNSKLVSKLNDAFAVHSYDKSALTISSDYTGTDSGTLSGVVGVSDSVLIHFIQPYDSGTTSAPITFNSTGVSTLSPDQDSTNWQTIAVGVTFNLAGVWANQTYNKFDIVNYNGSSYISKINQTVASTPENDSTNWQLFAQ